MKWWSKGLIVGTLLVSAVGCTGANDETAGKTGTGSSSSAAPGSNATTKSEKPIEISWLSFDFPKDDGSIGQKYIEEKFNVKLKNIRIDRTNWKDQLNVFLASGEVPDVWLLWGISDVDTYSKQNLLTELPVDEIRAKIPELAAFVDEKNPSAWNDGLIAGKSYGIPITNLDGAYPLLPYYNQNWLKAIGYNEPPKTFAEFEDVMYKFRNNDPDGNGKKDTYGITGKGATSIADSFQNVFGAFDIAPTYWALNASGDLQYGLTTEQSRQAMKVLNKWFKDGVIDPEFITADGKKEEFLNGLVGTTTASWTYHRPSVQEQDKKTKSNFFPRVAGKVFGAEGYKGYAPAWGITGNYLGMGIDVGKTPGKKEKIWEILNAMYTDMDTMMFLSYGQEGVHYDMVDGLPTKKPEIGDQLKNMGIGSFYGLLPAKAMKFEPMRSPKADLDWRAKVSADVPMLFNQVKFILPSAGKFPDLSNLEKQYFIKFITGEVDLDGGFENFVKEWKKAGGEVLTKEANEIYKSK
ncbi:Lipoprotein LipO precursor [Paenibacillus konkukensis]|uniref:Lipoprotein LipO n=1 Tax=Paenibacillus konkukensis TaxID=2020716 RepID=A0ABY4S2B0_9BACL|nr:extracellular solute-binding protein [Paenibacillus konkukensis]UQZ87538.1 Lipoprotein LipO precursor [Paenibacillus konkukensis]